MPNQWTFRVITCGSGASKQRWVALTTRATRTGVQSENNETEPLKILQSKTHGIHMHFTKYTFPLND